MQRIKNITFLFALLLLFSCIKAYDPVIESNDANKYVVSGHITDTEGWQEVYVSLSSPIESPEYIPVSDCQVKIVDDRGNIFSLDEDIPGQYRVWMEQVYLMPGTSYKVSVTIPGGEELVSGFDKMPRCPILDTVYYSIVTIPTTDPAVNPEVLQFYVDLNAKGDYSQYYKYEVEETWEYHAPRPAEYYYDGTHHQIIPPDSSNKICWITVPVKNVFTISTRSLSQNTYKQYPLHHIDGHSARLGILYSMLVHQLALSEQAYNYWEQLRINSNDQGGLYEKQPLAIKGNLRNANNPEREVLGFFYAASESARRYFYKDIEGLVVDYSNACPGGYLPRFGWKEFYPTDYPVYYYYSAGVVKTLSLDCVDCRALGGSTVKPDFWP